MPAPSYLVACRVLVLVLVLKRGGVLCVRDVLLLRPYRLVNGSVRFPWSRG